MQNYQSLHHQVSLVLGNKFDYRGNYLALRDFLDFNQRKGHHKHLRDYFNLSFVEVNPFL